MIVTSASSQRFVAKTRLPSPPPRTRSRSVENTPPLAMKSTEAQTLVVGSGLVIAAEKVPAQTREDLVNCTLFAQLVATAEVGDASKVNEWYTAYFGALSALGWAQSDQRFERYHFESSGAIAHEAVIPVITALLGPGAAALTVLQAAFDGLKTMSDNAPWLTLFERQSRQEQSAHFQVATAEVAAGGVLQIALAAFDLQAHTEMTQVLFFKFNKARTRLNFSSGKATIYEAALAGQREALATRLAAYRQAYVGQVKLPALPNLPPLPGPAMPADFDPAAFAQRQLEAYNARDLARFIAEYTEDVQVWRLPGAEPVLVGRAALSEHYRTKRFNLPGLHAEVVQRMVFGNKVIDQERVTGVQATPMEVAAIYEVTPAGISKVWFVSGA